MAGLVWAPYTPAATATLQRSPDRTRILTLYAVVAAIAVPTGTLAGGILVTAIGARETLLCSAVCTVLWGLCTPRLTSGTEL